jgi:hypothetical protein
LRFGVTTDVPAPYDLYWKVRNFGPDAEAASDLRGQLRPGSHADRVHTERTKYRGRHYIECYIVKGGKVLASDRHSVTIG